MARRRTGTPRRRLAIAAVLAATCAMGGAVPAPAAAGEARPAPAAGAPYPCGPHPGQAINGEYGDASALGWPGNGHGVVACLGGSFYVEDSLNATYGFGIYTVSPTSWVNAGGDLPALVTSFHRDRLDVSITNFADELVLGGNPYVAVYSRVAVRNPTRRTATADPRPTPGLVPLTTAPTTVAPQATVDHDYVVAVDRFGGAYPWPSSASLQAAGGFDAHFAHMRAFWDAQLAQIAQIRVPDPRLGDAYRAGYIYTQIARSGDHLDTGVNAYDSEFSHDVIGILANLFTQGDFGDAHALLLDARSVVGSQDQYPDGAWTYAWPWAIYLLKTGDAAFVRANFDTEGPDGPSTPSIEDAAHSIAAARRGPGGTIERTADIDTLGSWTLDNYEALMGLSAYRYLASSLGDTTETAWATTEYQSLLAATNRTLDTTIAHYHLHYLPCAMNEPNTFNRCDTAADANWAAPFLSGRWAWDGSLFGAPITGPGVDLIDATYDYGFARLRGTLPLNTFGGYPNDYYSTGYNAGYGSWGLASARHRDQGILSYEFMIQRTQSGPLSWWESVRAPDPRSPWIGSHPTVGQGSSPHAWGMANANKVLLDSLVAQRSDGTLIVGRGVPPSWTRSGQTVTVRNFPSLAGQRLDLTMTTRGVSVSLTIGGDGPPGPVLVQLPAFLHNLRRTTVGTVDGPTGTVRLPPGTRHVVVTMRHPA